MIEGQNLDLGPSEPEELLRIQRADPIRTKGSQRQDVVEPTGQ